MHIYIIHAAQPWQQLEGWFCWQSCRSRWSDVTVSAGWFHPSNHPNTVKSVPRKLHSDWHHLW